MRTELSGALQTVRPSGIDSMTVEHSLKNSLKPFLVESGKKFTLSDHDPGNTLGFKTNKDAQKKLKEGVARMSDMQQKLYAQSRWGVLLIFQAMDAAGKDGVIRHVMSGVNPQGCQVYSFKSPSAEELDHDFLWRTSKCLPERGRIGIFNRSYYEETLVVRVHPDLMAKQMIPPQLVTKKIWKQRFEDINNLESYLTRNGVVVRKFFLNISKEEQKQRFLRRLEDPDRNWKFSKADAEERGYWDEYMVAYEDMIRNTATAEAPWYVVPADNKWFTRLVVAAAIIDTLEGLDLHYPEVDEAKKKELEVARKLLEKEPKAKKKKD
jgi:PPK2 family polyphosphate:nucleotide phosphotransferase